MQVDDLAPVCPLTTDRTLWMDFGSRASYRTSRGQARSRALSWCQPRQCTSSESFCRWVATDEGRTLQIRSWWSSEWGLSSIQTQRRRTRHWCRCKYAREETDQEWLVAPLLVVEWRILWRSGKRWALGTFPLCYPSSRSWFWSTLSVWALTFRQYLGWLLLKFLLFRIDEFGPTASCWSRESGMLRGKTTASRTWVMSSKECPASVALC